MRIYSFQIHTEFGDFDEVYNYESYDDMVKAWKSKKESYVKMVGQLLMDKSMSLPRVTSTIGVLTKPVN